MEFNRNVQPPININIPSFIPKGSETAYKMLMEEAKKGKQAKFLVYYDPDIDGLMAGLLAEQYLERLGLKNEYYQYRLNNNRAHGFKLSDEDLMSLRGYTIIAVDFSVEKKDVDRVLKAGINLIVIDHHEINKKSYTDRDSEYVFLKYSKNNTYAIILNNQYSNELENFRFLSGAGMVYYFLKYVESKVNIPVYADAPAMVGISLLSDIRVLENTEARMFLKYTFNLDSEYMKYLQWIVTSESGSAQRFMPFGVPCMTRDFIDFTFSPIINSLLRADLGEKALKLLKGDQETINFMRTNDTILAYRQIQKDIIGRIMQKVKETENTPGSLTRSFSNMKTCCLTSDFRPYEKYDITNYIGVACSKIKDEDKTGVILVVDKDTYKVIRGSVRGGRDGVDYLSIFQKNGVLAAGHKSAFGILECDVRKIDFDKINSDIKQAELEFLNTQKNTRSVLETNNFGSFMKSPIAKKVAKYNDLSRDNYRIYVKVNGDFNGKDMDRVKANKVSDKFIKYNIDNVSVSCYDPSLDLMDSVVLIGVDNNKFLKCTLRQGFDYDMKSDTQVVMKKLTSIQNL